MTTEESIQPLLDSSLDHEAIDKTGQTSLHWAAKKGNLTLVKLWLEYDIGKLNLIQYLTQRDENGKTALHLAAEVYAIEVIQYLRTKSNNQLDEIKDNEDFSALDCIRFIQTKKKVSNENFSKKEILEVSNTIKALIENHKLKKTIARLFKNIKTGNLDGVKKLIENNRKLLESRDKYTNTPLFEAIYSEKFAIADYLIDAGADVNARSHEGESPLHRAVWVKDEAIVLKLFKKGANVNALNDHGAVPLLNAVGAEDNRKIIDLLLEHGATLNQQSQYFYTRYKQNCFHRAAVNGCNENIKYLIEIIKDKNILEQADGYGRFPIHLAAEKNYDSTIQLLHDLGCKITHQDDYARTALHMAAFSGAIGTAEYLLNNGADLGAIDNKKRTPLHLAARNGQLEMIKYLVTEKLADTSKTDLKGQTPAEVAKKHNKNYLNEKGNFDPVKLQAVCELLSQNRKRGPTMTKDEHIQEILLFQAINWKDTDEVKRLLAAGINRKVVDEDGQTPLHHAVAIGNLEIVQALLEDNLGKLNLAQFIGKRDKDGKTALHLAAENCAINIIRYLRIKSNNQLDNIKDSKGFTALDGIRSLQTMRKVGGEKFSSQEMHSLSNTIKALIENPKLEKVIAQLLQYIEQGNLAGVKELITKNPELLESRNGYTNTPLFEAIYSKQFDIANYLIEAGADVNARCHEGKSPLHRAVWVKNKNIVLKLIEKMANVNALDDHKSTPLLDAAGIDDNIEIIEVLLKHEVMLNVCNGLKRNIIHIAAADNCTENIQYFFKNINDKEIFEPADGFGRRPLHLAAEQDHIEAIQILVELGGKIDAQDIYGRTAFNLAAEKNKIKALQKLAKLGCSKDLPDEYGRTPVHLAAEKNNVETLECLFNLGCKKDTQDKYWRTPLHTAASSGAINAAEYLLNNGAKLEAVDNEKRTPLHLAARDGQLEMIKYLIGRKADLSKKDFNGRTPLEVAKTHLHNYADNAKLQEACDFLSGNLGNKKWYSQPKDSEAPQRFYPQPRQEWKSRQSSKFDTSEKESWRPRKP